jgi:hypothetical protein
MTARLTVISWRDIPAQVIAKDGEKVHKVELEPRFQVAIDRAAMQAGLFGTDEYLGEWRKEVTECGSDIVVEAERKARLLEEQFPGPVLDEYVASMGKAP